MGKRKRRQYSDDFRAGCVLMLEAAGYPDRGDSTIYGIYCEGIAKPLRKLVYLMIDVMVTQHRDEVERKYPRLIELNEAIKNA